MSVGESRGAEVNADSSTSGKNVVVEREETVNGQSSWDLISEKSQALVFIKRIEHQGP